MFYVITVITTIVRILKIKKQNLNKLALPSDITDWKKYIYSTMKNSLGQRKEGKKKRINRIGSAPRGERTEAGVKSPHQGNCLGQR